MRISKSNKETAVYSAIKALYEDKLKKLQEKVSKELAKVCEETLKDEIFIYKANPNLHQYFTIKNYVNVSCYATQENYLGLKSISRTVDLILNKEIDDEQSIIKARTSSYHVHSSDTSRSVDVPKYVTNSCNSTIVVDSSSKKCNKVLQPLKDLVIEIRQTAKEIRSVLNSVNTIGQLEKTCPDLVKHLPKPPPSTQLVDATTVSKVNSLFK